MFIFLFVMAALIPVIMIFLGTLYKPPKNINGTNGYRTTRSMKSQDTWDFAQFYYKKIFLRIGIITLIPSVIFMFIFKKNFEWAFLWIVGIQVVIICLSIIPVERALKKNFDEYGLKK